MLAESGFIVQYLTEHFTTAKNLVPKRWKDGQEGKIGGETEEWMRYQYLMYYVEGSFMATFVMYYVLSGKLRSVTRSLRGIRAKISCHAKPLAGTTSRSSSGL